MMKKRLGIFVAAASVCVALRVASAQEVPKRLASALRTLGESGIVTELLCPPSASVITPEEADAESSLPPRRGITRTAALTKAPAASAPQKNASQPARLPEVNNKSGCELDLAAELAAPLGFRLSRDSAQILILHTHGSEAYSQSGGEYAESDRSRTEDRSKSVIRVGDVLADSLASAGLHVLHDRELYDYPSYSGSYSRSLASAERYLADYPGIKVVFDLHRDALYTPDGEAVRRVCTLPDGAECAKIMLIAATGSGGLYFDTWRENLRFALKLQAKMDELFPGLAEPIYITSERYNEHTAPGYLVAELGTDGNTLAEAELAAEKLAECVSLVLAEVIDD